MLMDKMVLKLLFNWHGSLTYKQFRGAAVILFMLIGSYFTLMLTGLLANLIMGKLGSEWIASFSTYSRVIESFFPTLVPVGFVLSYSSFIVAFKRMRFLSASRAIRVFSGIVNYLFFASCIAMVMSLGHNLPFSPIEGLMQSVQTIVSIIFFIGLIHFIFLSAAHKGEDGNFPVRMYNGRINIPGYILKIGNLILVTVPVVLVVIVLFIEPEGVSFFTDKFGFYVLGGISIITLFFYLKYTIFRLRHAGVSIYWLVGIVGFYSGLILVEIFLVFGMMKQMVFFSFALIDIATRILIAFQYLLFFLPEKAVQEK